MQLAHRIELRPTPEQVDYFKRACGAARKVWNWALAEWRRQYAAGGRPNAMALKKQFNALMNVGKRKNAPTAGGAADTNSADSASGLVPQSAGNSPEQKEKIERALAILGNVKEWKEPTRKGKRVYDDKAFYSSINDQYRSGRSLSPKQIFAIEKMSGKYASGKAVKKEKEGGGE